MLGFRGVIVAPAQLIHQMLKMGRQTRGLGAKIFLQPFAHGIADRSAGLTIDLFAVVVDSAHHGVFRFVVISKWLCSINSRRRQWLRPISQMRVFLVKMA
jgi:hypothetical protein